MPSASTTKPEKQASTEAASSESSSSTSKEQNTPLRQAVVIIEHKIRNLEKRKSKLENYKELQAQGKELHQDQKVAVAKYEEVFQTLEFAKDLCKQFNNIVTASEKEAKKLARKEASQRIQQDTAKIREVLLVQDVLQKLGDDAIREDFLCGRNGATQISAEDLQLLDNLYLSLSPKHAFESPEGPEFSMQVQQAAEHMLSLVDAKPKEFSGSTYAHVKGIIDSIHKCGYLEIVPAPVETPEVETWNQEGVVTVQQTEESVIITPATEMSHGQQCPVLEPERILEHGSTANVSFPPVPEVISAVVPVVEQPYFPPQPQPRPITEMLGAGSFFFLQESELDSPPELVVQHPMPNASAPIPSQTFTNQNLANVPAAVLPIAAFPGQNPPPPIPMPPSHLSPQQQQLSTIPAYSSEPPAATNFPPTQQFETFTISQTDVENGNIDRDEDKNGAGDWAEATEERGNGNHGNRQRGGGGGGGGGGGNRNRNNYYQNNYYQNNGYGGGNYKPRGGNRSGGPRTGGGGGGPKGHYNRSKPSAQQQQH